MDCGDRRPLVSVERHDLGSPFPRSTRILAMGDSRPPPVLEHINENWEAAIRELRDSVPPYLGRSYFESLALGVPGCDGMGMLSSETLKRLQAIAVRKEHARDLARRKAAQETAAVASKPGRSGSVSKEA